MADVDVTSASGGAWWVVLADVQGGRVGCHVGCCVRRGMWDEACLAAWWAGEETHLNTYQEWRLTRWVITSDIFTVHKIKGNIVHIAFHCLLDNVFEMPE